MNNAPSGTYVLQNFNAFRVVWALCDIRRTSEASVLNVSHFAVCLHAGREPMWGVFSARTGRVDRFYAGRWQVEEAFPKKVWRRMVGTWSLGRVSDDLSREEVLKLLYEQQQRTKRVA